MLVEKLNCAARSGLEARVVTQICFDPANGTSFVEALRRSGRTEPVSLGLVGPARLELLRRMALQCGVNLPPALSLPPADRSAAEAEESLPTDCMRHLSRWQASRSTTDGMQAIHLYPFGGLLRTVSWFCRVARTEDIAGLGLPPEVSCLDVVSGA